MKTIKSILSLCAVTLEIAAFGEASPNSEHSGLPYAWRGYMLDVSRHFFTVPEIKKTLDAMATVKLNVFHWHLTDNPGWRIQIDAYPELTKSGATDTVSSHRRSTMGLYETDGQYGPFFYTKDEIRDIVAYAARLGITVVPEIDVPGHSGAAIRAYPELACRNAQNARELCLGKEATLRFYERILNEVFELFPSQAIHLGGDECNTKNWAVCPDCQARISALKLRGEKGLQGWFMAHVARYLESKGRRMVAWDDVVEFGDLPESTIAMVYRRKKPFGPVAAARGYDVVMTSGYYWDYVQGLSDDPYEYQPFGYVCTWRKIMNRELAEGFSPEARRHLLGAEGCMWTELVCDLSGVEWRTWPRMAALAQVLNGDSAAEEQSFVAKLSAASERLKTLGVNVAPLGPLFDESVALEPGVRCLWQREDFAKMLPNPVDASVLCFDWGDRSNAYEKVYARRDAGYPDGAYLLDMDWRQVEVTASTDAGFENALRQIRKLARPKKGGVIELPSCRLSYGEIPPVRIDLAKAFSEACFAPTAGDAFAYRWHEPRHMQLGGNYPLLVVSGASEDELVHLMEEMEMRHEESFVCAVDATVSDDKIDALIKDLAWRTRCLNAAAVRKIR